MVYKHYIRAAYGLIVCSVLAASVKKDFIYNHVFTYRLSSFLKEHNNEFQQTFGSLSPHCLVDFARHLWKVECDNTYDNLVFWNEREEFPSLGLCHFIWFPTSVRQKKMPFIETFPGFLAFIKPYKEALDSRILINEQCACPWQTREEFYALSSKKSLYLLRKFIERTLDLQICYNLYTSHQKLLAAMQRLSPQARAHAQKQMNRLVACPGGMFALMDYTSFKGVDDPVENYQGYGWGVLNVLEQMKGTSLGIAAVQEFVRAALVVLTRRIEHAPAKRQEKRFLQGWRNRLMTYVAIS